MRGRTKRIGIVLCCLVSISMFSYCLLPVKADAAARFSCSHDMCMYVGEFVRGGYETDATYHWHVIDSVVECGACGTQIVTKTYDGPKEEHDMAAFSGPYGTQIIKCRVCGEQEK